MTPSKAPIEHQSIDLDVRTTAEDKIRGAIVSGELLPGQRLTERELCAFTGAARTTVREAMRLLESEGLITTTSHRGAIVSVLTEQEAQDIYELRAILEGQAGRLFVKRATDLQVIALSKIIEDIGRSHEEGNIVGVIQNSNKFYAALTGGAGNEELSDVLTALFNRLALFRFTSTRWPGRVERSMAELREIGAAIRARDGDAAEAACVRHVKAAAEIALLVLAERARGAAIAMGWKRSGRQGA